MRILRSLGLLFLASCAAPGAAEPFPVSNVTYFPQGKVDVAFVDRLVALRGEVEAIETGPQGKPLFKLDLAGVPTSVWVGSLVVVENQEIEALHLFEWVGVRFTGCGIGSSTHRS